MAERVVHEQVGEPLIQVCSLGHTHRGVRTFRRYVLDVVETRQVPNMFARGYGDYTATSTGYRAVDQFGDEWRSDWYSSHSDGYGGPRMWVTEDGRISWEAKGDGTPVQAGDGWILQGDDGGDALGMPHTEQT